MATEKTNGLHAETDPEGLLEILSEETIGPSYGYVSLKLTQGDQVRHVRLKIKPIDILALARELDEMPADVKASILEQTKLTKSVGFSDENWLQALSAFVYGLAAPHILKVGKTTVWVAEGEPQRLPDAMIAVCRIGFDYWHINDVSNAITELTRDRTDEAFAGNS